MACIFLNCKWVFPSCCIKEHKNDTHNSREKRAIVKKVLAKNININNNNTKKLSNYNNRNYAYCRETLKIVARNKACNTIEHFQ